MRQGKDKHKGTPLPSSFIERKKTHYIIKKKVLYSNQESKPIPNNQFLSDISIEKEVEKSEVGSNLEVVDNPLVINLEQEIEEG